MTQKKIDQKYAPMLDLLIPMPSMNSVFILPNRKKVEYLWSDNYCEEYKK